MVNYVTMNAHFLSVFIVTAAMLATSMNLVRTYHFSGASTSKGLIWGAILLLCALITWVSLSRVPNTLGPLGALIIPECWTTPSQVLWVCRDWILAEPLSQHWLVGLRALWVIGGVFLIEYIPGNIPPIFAYSAGIGGPLVGLLAASASLPCIDRKQIPDWTILLVLVLRVSDFINAFFFKYLRSEIPAQSFCPDIKNNALIYPTGIIPRLLVPHAIFFHTFSWLSRRCTTTSNQVVY